MSSRTVAEPSAWASTRFVIAASWRSSPLAVLISLLEVLGRVLESLTPLFVGLVVAGVVEQRLPAVAWGAGGLIASHGLVFLVTLLGVHSRMIVNDRMGFEFDQRSARLSGGTPTMDHLVDPAHRDRLQTLTERRGAMGMAFQSFVNVLNNLATPITGFVVAWAVDPRLLLLLLVVLPIAYSVRLTARWDARAETDSAADGRLSNHLMESLTTAAPASELRVMGARDRMAARVGHAVLAWRRPQASAAVRSSLLASILSTVYLLAAGAVLWWLVADALAGRVSAGTVAAALLVVSALRESSGSMLWVTQLAARMTRIGRRALWLERYAEEVTARYTGTASPPAKLRHGIRLRDVTFTYPGASTPTFQRFSLDLPAGSTVAVVGENGAGKSTLVNVLTGMYDLDAGEITVDGTPLTTLVLAVWREHSAGAFQDHARFELTAREAISLGDLQQEPTDDVVHGALERAAASDVLTALPNGLETQLGPEWGGVGLSGGQWQRLAIARGMMRRHPLLLVLDEPTSALDPATEHALFDGYAEAARRTRDNGGITVLVTHRFSTVSAADLVVVMADGAVAEVGTHEQLLAAGGTYAELYGLQAAGYR
ncbi:ABC transporter ATP-binding protein [Enemella sp. A6]|uniref:ABC transporter ATP-binding protein n=1 Tax=Enemella sp. A6 TaxID=3440152 RepID=UPI003EBC98BA